MNFGVRKEEAEFLRDLIMWECLEYGVERLREVYGNIDIEGMLKQLDIIVICGDSVKEDDKKIW